MSAEIIGFKGKKVLFADYTTCKTKEAMIANVREVAEVMQMHSDRMLVLADFNGTFASPEFMSEMKRLTEEVFKDKSEKVAAIGITGIKKILLNAMLPLYDRNIKVFDTREEALNYLVN